MGRTELQKLIEQKKLAKKQILAHFWPQKDAKKKDDQAILIVLSPTEHKDQIRVFAELLQGLLILPMHVVILSEHDAPNNLEKGKIGWVNLSQTKHGKNTAQKKAQYFLAADLGLIFEEHQSTIQELFANGVVPVGAEKSPLLENYRPNEETGNSFTFDSLNPWAIFLALGRTVETFKFPYDWQHILRAILNVR